MGDEADLTVVYSGKVDDVLSAAAEPQDTTTLDVLFDLAQEAGVDQTTTVLDVGCATGWRSRELIRRTGCQVDGIEFLPQLVGWGREQIEEEGFTDRLRIEEGTILDLARADESYDVVWCTDVFGIIAELDRAIDECARVLTAGGQLISYVSLATSRMAPFEQDELDRAQGSVSTSMNRENLERSFERHFSIERRIVIGGQHSQCSIEQGDDQTLENLVRASRLLTWPERYRPIHGDTAYRAALTEALWGAYQLLGKIDLTAYLLRKRA